MFEFLEKYGQYVALVCAAAVAIDGHVATGIALVGMAIWIYLMKRGN